MYLSRKYICNVFWIVLKEENEISLVKPGHCISNEEKLDKKDY